MHLHVVCPHCHNPIELVEKETPQEALCPSCGSSFHLETGGSTQPHVEGINRMGKLEIIDNPTNQATRQSKIDGALGWIAGRGRRGG